jgi:hypothetical protein
MNNTEDTLKSAAAKLAPRYGKENSDAAPDNKKPQTKVADTKRPEKQDKQNVAQNVAAKKLQGDSTKNAGLLAAEDAANDIDDNDYTENQENEYEDDNLEKQNDDAQETDDEDVEETQENQGDEGDEENLFEVLVNGERIGVSLEELLQGYQRTADYSIKTEELAKKRKAVEELEQGLADLPQLRQAYEKGSKEFLDNSVQALALIDKFLPQQPSADLLEKDPRSYIIQKENHEKAMQYKAAIQQQIALLHRQKDAALASEIEKARVILYKSIPELRLDENRTRLLEYVHKGGYTAEEISRNSDHRLFEYAYKAMKYDALMRAKKNIKPTAQKQKVIKSQNVRVDEKTLVRRQKSDAMNAHYKEKSIKSAAKALAASIKANTKSKF